jgi:outer membrane lipoprotein-sorting protein
MRSADDIRRLFKNAELDVGPDADERVFEDMLKARQIVAENRPLCFLAKARAGKSIWRIIMKSPLTKLAAAASVLVACVIGLSLWTGTQSGIALADVLAQIEKVIAYRYQCSSKMTSMDPNKPYSPETRVTKLISQEYGAKTKFERPDPNGGWSTFQEGYIFPFPEEKTMILIYPEQKKYTRIELDDRYAEFLWQINSEPSFWAKRILGCKYESMGRSIVDGIEVEGFRTTDPNILPGVRDVDNKMWVDVKTRLPVRYDFRCAHVDKMGNKTEIEQIVYHNFRWDVHVDTSEFKPVIPDGSIGTVIKYPAHITEEIAIQGLKLLVELLGKYPEETPNFDETVLRLAEKSETPAALRLKEETKGLAEDEIVNKLADFLMPIRGVVRFYVLLVQDKKDPAYYGKTVTPKDADKVLLRWKLSDNEYRVIYGDLHAETVTKEKLAELEAALPK